MVFDQATCDADPLVEAHEMRTGEGVNRVAARFECSAQERSGRTFAIRAGNVEDRGKGVLRAAEPGKQSCNALKAEPIARWREIRQAIELLLDARMRGAREIGHQAASF